ncbi:hypothetical protein SDC9_122128 [bioreactor metagenome]|uniref:Uncharacterized protein n=1 Tax=bioreactor metagenome TaxID=1076179 RepID=A0A645CDW8_9ZZZZ
MPVPVIYLFKKVDVHQNQGTLFFPLQFLYQLFYLRPGRCIVQQAGQAVSLRLFFQLFALFFLLVNICNAPNRVNRQSIFI